MQIKDPLRLSLCNIALKALQKEQEDRYQSVDELKEAIQGFNKQVQSLKLVATGRESRQKAEGGEGYLHLLPALESFRGAQTLWPEGEDAKKFQTETACEYARRADHRKDFDAGLSILDEYTNEETRHDENVVSLVSKLQRGKKIAARNRRLATIGWAAAVILPVAVFFASWWGTALLRSQNKTLVAQAETARDEIKSVELEAKAAQQKADTAKREAELAKQDVLKAEADKIALAAEVAKAESEIKKAETEKVALAAEVRKAEVNVSLAKERLAKAELEQAAADAKVEKAKYEVDQLRASSAEDQFKSLLLPIPLDIRKGKLEQARSRLEKLRDSKLSEQFKNGWVAHHFAKVVNVKGVEHRLGDNTLIIDIEHGNGDFLISVGYQDGVAGVWRTDAQTGQSSRLDIQLPAYGRMADAAVSADGKWLALALDQVVNGGDTSEHFWLTNLETGEHAGIPEDPKMGSAANDGVLGCRLIGFAQTDAPDRLQLITLEELSAYRGLKQRLQVATRDVAIEDQTLSVGEPTTTAISATSRGLDSVRSIAAMNELQGRTAIAIVYQSLNSEGRDKIVLESLVADDQGEFQGTAVDLGQYPTALHIGPTGQLYCGYADGSVSQYEVARLTRQPIRSASEHESPVTVLDASGDGKVVSGSRDGVMIVFDENMNFIKRLVGQPDSLTSVSIANVDGPNGFQLASGGAEGYVRVWNPNGTLHDAAIEKSSQSTAAGMEQVTGGALRLSGNNRVLCGAVDQYFVPRDVPATAYGTADGQVVYFNPAAMQASQQGGQEISAGDVLESRVSIAPPAGTFDSAFRAFDSFGIVGDQFMLLQSDGQLFYTKIESGTELPSPELGLTDATGGNRIVPDFQPLLASQPHLPFFFTTDPANENEMLFWIRRDNQGFQPSKIASNSTQAGRIKRLSLSPDGNWLAVVREVARRNASGEYITEVFRVAPDLPGQDLRLASKTNRYRVGDPAFVGFSADSRQIVLHFHKLGVDRETWIENWSLSGGKWQQAAAKRKIDDRHVDLIAWDGRDLMVTKSNRRFYLVNKSTDRTQEIRGEKAQRTNRDRLRDVRPVGPGGSQYVLFSQGLERFDENGAKDEDAQNRV